MGPRYLAKSHSLVRSQVAAPYVEPGPCIGLHAVYQCEGDTVPLAVGRWYNFHKFGCYLANVG